MDEKKILREGPPHRLTDDEIARSLDRAFTLYETHQRQVFDEALYGDDRQTDSRGDLITGMVIGVIIMLPVWGLVIGLVWLFGWLI
jgi:hypothetical protein